MTISNIVKSQTKALTENGREVLLYADGTWKFSQDSSNKNTASPDTLKLNPNKYTKPSGATFLVKSNIFNIGVFINPNKWTFELHRDNETIPEYRFSLKTGEGFVMMISEKIPLDLETLRQIALLNARDASIDVKETFAEYRIVNGKKVLCLELQGTIKGIKFTYFGYYYSNSNGTVQLLSYSTEQYFGRIQKELENFLNGLVEVEK